MPRTKRPEWLRKLAKALGPDTGDCDGYKRAERWANKYKTFAAAWAALKNWEWMVPVINLIDPHQDKYDCAESAKANAFHRRFASAVETRRCDLFRRAWPGVPRVVGRVLRKVKLP